LILHALHHARLKFGRVEITALAATASTLSELAIPVPGWSFLRHGDLCAQRHDSRQTGHREPSK